MLKGNQKEMVATNVQVNFAFRNKVNKSPLNQHQKFTKETTISKCRYLAFRWIYCT